MLGGLGCRSQGDQRTWRTASAKQYQVPWAIGKILPKSDSIRDLFISDRGRSPTTFEWLPKPLFFVLHVDFPRFFSSFLLFLAGSMFWSDLFFRTHMTHGYPLKVEAFQSFWSPPTLRWALAVHWQCTVGSCGTKNADTYPLISPPKKEECQGFFFCKDFFFFFFFLFLKKSVNTRTKMNDFQRKPCFFLLEWVCFFFCLGGFSSWVCVIFRGWVDFLLRHEFPLPLLNGPRRGNCFQGVETRPRVSLTHFTERQRTRSFSGCIPSTPTERIESKEFGVVWKKICLLVCSFWWKGCFQN